MIKHFLSVLIFISIFLFIFFVTSTIISNNNKKKIRSNRTNLYLKIEENLANLPILKNDTDNVIEFNSGFTNNDSKTKRNFWNLFKK